MSLYQNELYLHDIEAVANDPAIPWERLNNKTICITGATGMIGSFLIDVLMYKNDFESLNTKVLAFCRNYNKFANRFNHYLENPLLQYFKYDANEPIDDIVSQGSFEYFLHLASNTHPLQYAANPINTITINVLGLKNLLDFAIVHDATRFLFASSNEVYGENRGDVEQFTEEYCGYINSNTLRAGYPESKRCGEALCQAYIEEKGLDIVIPRITRSYGPTLLKDDSKALSQFLNNGLNKEDIVLKSAGNQYYSYQYVSDTVSGILYVLLKGNCGEAYNIAAANSDIKLKDLAQIIADYSGTKVVFDLPNEMEAKGFSKATKARLDGKKLQSLGWSPTYDITTGIQRTLKILEEI